MKWVKLFQTAQGSLIKNRTRSFLTMLGIIIGVAAVIVMVGIGKGAQERIQKQIASLGTNLVIVRSGNDRYGGISRGAGSAQNLTLDDVDQVRLRARTLDAVSPFSAVNVQAVHGNNNWNTQICGVSPDYLIIRDWEVAEGSFFTEKDSRNRSKVAVIGTTVRDNLFPGQQAVGQSIRVNATPFKVIGVLESKGQSAMGTDQDDTIFAPVESVLFRLKGDTYVNRMYASARSAAEMTTAQTEIAEILRQVHRLPANAPDDFSLRTQTEITDMASATSETLTLLLGAIAGVSLLVGGIGIMNIMLVSVTERTREIGIRMAVGARSADVLLQFLVEALVLSVLGGFIGVLFSAAMCFALARVWSIPTVMSTPIVLLSLAVSGAIGMFFGLYPARKAANLDPIEALHRE